MYNKLLENVKIGKYTLKNRMVYAPTVSCTSDAAGGVSSKTLALYNRVSKGGASLVYVGAVSIGPKQLDQPVNLLGLYSNKFVNGMADLVEVIHKNGALAGVQVFHMGRQGVDDVVGFSDVPSPLTNIPVRVLTEKEIEKYEDMFAMAAFRGKMAGFDMVDLHFSHGYLGGSSLSPHTNKRNDRYGGSFEKRMTFALNVIRKTRKLVGDDYVLTCRIVTSEMIDGGITLEDSKAICKKFEEEGIAAINLSIGVHEAFYYSLPPYQISRGFNAKNSHEIKKILNIPVGIAGRINDPKLADHIIVNQYADYILLSRGLIADEEFPKKVKENRADEIRRCVACNQCVREVFNGRSLGCQVNPLVGREKNYENISVHRKKKNVFVIGAGPAGLEAARAAAIRGHNVTLYEKEKELSSPQYRYLLQAKVNREFSTVLKFYEKQFSLFKNIKIHLNNEVEKDFIFNNSPDVVILATGAKAIFPGNIDGISKPGYVYNCFSFFDAYNNTLLDDKKEFCVVGEDIVACDIADFLSRKGKKVCVIAKTNIFPDDVEKVLAYYFLKQFSERGNVDIITNSIVEKINNYNVVYSKLDENKKYDLRTECIIFANCRQSSNVLLNEIKDIVPEVYVIGDAKEPRLIIDAVREGFLTGMNI